MSFVSFWPVKNLAKVTCFYFVANLLWLSLHRRIAPTATDVCQGGDAEDPKVL
jgi:hypothetical protein